MYRQVAMAACLLSLAVCAGVNKEAVSQQKAEDIDCQ